MISAFLGAVQFLTVIPVHGRTANAGRSAAFFPLVGGLLGLAGAVLFEFAVRLVPAPLAALLVILFWALLTGALHEDGVADVGDALRAYRSREHMLAILKDSRIGAHGALALLFSVLFRWQALSAITADPIPALAASQAVPRAALVGLAWVARPATSGMGGALQTTLSTPLVLAALAQGLAFALWCGVRPALLLTAGSVLIVIAARAYFHRRLGGITGDCLGATSQIVEAYVLLVFACRYCIW